MTVKVWLVQIAEVIAVIAGLGSTVTITVNVPPTQLPVIGVTI